ncbi:MAG TPA: FAD-dependent oxidoreductase [Blastocatellia bacterium]|nr:FAD-dependent oxidoreductase [Blastocatellia bacterium]
MRVAIIGGGFSGLAAGVALAERGHEIILLEKRNHLGGRAYSFVDAKTGDVVDNGQHLFMGCYRHTIAFLEKIGCLDRLKFQDRPRVDFLDAERRLDAFECPALALACSGRSLADERHLHRR